MTTTEFQKFLNVLLPASDCTLDEFVDLMIINALFNDECYANEPVDELLHLRIMLGGSEGNATSRNEKGDERETHLG